MRFACTTLIAITLLGAGCATYTPQPLLPESELAALSRINLVEFSARPADGTANPALEQPFDLSDGLNETEVIAVALKLNPELRAARLAIGEAEALLITAGLWPNPEVGLDLRTGLSSGLGSIIESDLLFELLLPGEKSAMKESARARIQQVSAETLAAEWRVVAQTRFALIEVLAAEHAVALLGQEVALREQALELVRKRKQVGEGTELDVVVAELELAGVKREHRGAQTELGEAGRRLNRLLGLPPEYSLPLTESGKPLTITIYEELSGDELDRRLLRGRFELRAKEAAYRKAEQELRLAVTRQYPHLRLGPSLESAGEGTSLGLGVGIELPFFDRNQGEIAEKESQRQRVRSEYVALLHHLLADAHDAHAQLQRARLEVEIQQNEVLPLVDRTNTLFEKAFQTNELSVLHWVTAQQRTLAARREYLRSLVSYQKAVVQMETTTGVPLAQPAE